ncbi:3-deoxy-7-phosphoheptulonate synthase [Nocardioides szechwanensis]|uniref:3-deoxy-D-arabinoheptulosonate-7-phosphate synthase n=1 Tax=Nocardioides szechwanensis TaxID=1005944 RepID=A0A1G9VDM1_9ACTN|nr:3-deoxy-7-phosphoheptulonate synthase [Nocardioides szechwanensis]GEP32957.1 3-deoxy-7-phosphoheptulonate synthase [Nocardioides szechwanensis]SDM70180.1 3-deoxy-D-arabinoheptulosonate-7-phosphate synthase [Nocardioides szechwanensis]
MVVVMSPDATDEDVAHVVEKVEAVGGEAFVSKGVVRTIIGLVGDIESFHHLNLRTLPGVADVHRISDPYKLVSRQHHAERSTVWVGPQGAQVPIGPDTFTFMAGPCAVETPEQTLAAAHMARSAGATILRGGAFKPRTSPYAFQGLGLAGLRILADVRAATGLPIVTEVVDARDVPVVAEHADMLQVGTRNMANFGLLQAVGDAGKPVLLKRGMTATIEEWLMAAEYIAQRGNLDVVLCERGIRTFEPSTRNTLDISAVPVVQATSHLPIIVDPSHAAGRKDLVVPLSRAAIAVGADGIIVDVHPTPETALCDGPQALLGNDLRELATAVRRLPPVVGRVDAGERIRTA